MLLELANEKPLFGFHFGKAFRSISLEILNWGLGDWARDGWVSPHNSFLHVIYRTGIIGLAAIVTVLTVLLKMIKRSIQCRSLKGILLCGIVINWFTAANFLPMLELPYTAIPVWAIFGLAYAYVARLKPVVSSNK